MEVVGLDIISIRVVSRMTSLFFVTCDLCGTI
jgi:hypothetical protein